jgi:acyl-CoA synthetase (AMP-forming)/AMP-acid ligase II
VLDEEGIPVTEPGVEGELVVRGSIVAQGYWGDLVKTAAGFTEPYTYRTGDIVCWSASPDGPILRFIGRRDHMVKSRGYRVELGEIESVLNSHPHVEEAAAVAVPDELLGSRIVAFFVARAASAEESVAQLCRNRLPLYMVPQRIIALDVLPRTPNGKIDRRQLLTRAV